MAKTDQLKLLDIEFYIKKNDLKEVKNSNIFGTGKNTFDEEGLWSEIIFGQIGSSKRKRTFGYITLGYKLISPVIYDLIRNSSEEVRDILLEKRQFKIDKDGILKQDDLGSTGLLFLVNNYDKINFELNAKKDRKDVGKFLEKNKDLIFINKYLIIPPGGIRDLTIESRNVRQFSSEINDLYERLISLNNQLKIMEDSEMKSILAVQVQKILVQTYDWIQNRMSGKTGLMRGELLKKTMDYSARIIASQSPDISLGSIGIPWHTILAIYEPFFFHYVMKRDPDAMALIKSYLDIPQDQQLSYHELKGFNYSVTKNPENITGELKNKLFEIAREITKDKDILVKRDPVTARTSYFAATPIPVENKGAVVNALNCAPLGLDFDGDTLALFPVFTKEALKEAEKLNPSKSRTIWVNPSSYNDSVFSFTLDVVSTIFGATKA